MRSMFALAAVAALGLFGEPAPADPVGTLVLVAVNDGPKQVEAKVGDLLQFELTYPVVPGRMVSELKLDFAGAELTKVATVRVPKRSPEGRPLVGASAVAGFVRADKTGEVTVAITPRLLDGKEGERTEFKVKIAAN